MNLLLKLLCLLFPLFSVACTTLPPEDATLVVSNVTVIDPDRRDILPDRDVYLVDDRIAAILPHREERKPGLREIDGRERFLVPGLMDMHVHVAHPMFSDSSLPLFLANGVTGVREMSGDCWEPRGDIFACIDDYRELQAKIENGEQPGPRLLQLSSAIVRGELEAYPPHVPEGAADFVTPDNRREARELVTYLDERGVDFIKTYNWLSADAFHELLDAAAEHDLAVAGHVPLSVSSLDAVRHGLRSIEHARTLPYECSELADSLHAEAQARIDGARNEWYSNVELERQAMETFDLETCDNLMDALAAAGAWYVPTHETREMDAMAGKAAYRDDPRLEFVDPGLLSFWQRDLESTAGKGAEAAAVHQRFFEHGLALTGKAHRIGIRIMAGTDANDTMSIPGFSLHDELEHLAAAGLDEMDVLRTATTNPAEFLGRLDDFGGISAGRKADLVLLERNPLEDIRNTTSIEAVIIDGRVMSRGDLDTLLENVRAAGQRPWWADIAIVDVPASRLASFAGTYRLPSNGLEIVVRLEEGSLHAAAPGMPEVKLYPESPTRFFFREDPTRFEFTEMVDGTPQGLELTWSNGRSEVAQRQ